LIWFFMMGLFFACNQNKYIKSANQCKGYPRTNCFRTYEFIRIF
jgi:hypothetical protein